ncbi:MAG: hypothetical protein IJR22_07055 [Acidaminococcaceae bacterium]|nr:hypothetical protein [Acidaminococcaceae bacterium]
MADTKKVCKNCGAPVLSEVCQYCGCRVDSADTAKLSAEYETLDCKTADLTFWNTVFAGIFSVTFSFVGFLPLWLDSVAMNADRPPRFFFFIFAVVGVGATVIVIYSLYKYVLVSLKGKEITGIVYGYMDDVINYNHRPGQVCKILVETLKGKRFIYYSLQGTNKPYPINEKVRLKVYKNYFRIVKKPKMEEGLF